MVHSLLLNSFRFSRINSTHPETQHSTAHGDDATEDKNDPAIDTALL
jgi:hypothetical protein